jgi:hypothetical protein
MKTDLENCKEYIENMGLSPELKTELGLWLLGVAVKESFAEAFKGAQDDEG